MDEELREFMRARYEHLLRRSYLLTGNRSAAEELVQDALARCCIAWRQRKIDNPDAYVMRVMMNAQMSKWRRRSFREHSAESVPDIGVGDGSLERAEQDRMWRLLGKASRRQRAVLVLHYYEGLTEAEIAETLGLPVGTVRSHNARGLARLRELLVATTVSEESR